MDLSSPQLARRMKKAIGMPCRSASRAMAGSNTNFPKRSKMESSSAVLLNTPGTTGSTGSTTGQPTVDTALISYLRNQVEFEDQKGRPAIAISVAMRDLVIRRLTELTEGD